MVFNFNDKLPEKIPSHFDLSGTPDGWSGKSSLIILLFVNIGLNFLLYGVIFLLPWFRKHPYLMSSSGAQKKEFLALPEEKQKKYWDIVINYLAAMSLLINFLWISIT